MTNISVTYKEKSHTIIYIIFALSFFFIVGCKATKEVQLSKREYSVQSVLWQQNSSEYKALCYQAFNLAKYKLDDALAEKDNAKPLAIITDIDETILDNSPFNAKLIEQDVEYSQKNWTEWGKKKSATKVPGSLEFVIYANSKNVTVFYISNRHIAQKNETIENLKQLGYPNIKDEYILLKDNTSKKQSRRNKVLATYNVVMLLGDNLSDFAEEFDEIDRKKYIDNFILDFGSKFIVLPNPMYGDWETKGIYNGKYDWSEKEKDSIRKSKLIIN